jgi:rubredoxin
MIRTRLFEKGLLPAKEPRTIDTLKICRSKFKLLSNALGYVAVALGLETEKGKPPSWEDVHKGDPDIISEGERYCRQDVRVLEKVYDKIRPWRTNGVNMGVFVEGVEEYHKCPNCASLDVIRRGFRYTNAGKFQRFECKSCGAFSRGSKNFNKNELLKY